MTHGNIIDKDEKNGIIFRDFSEHGELVLEQERVKGQPSQVWIKIENIESFTAKLAVVGTQLK